MADELARIKQLQAEDFNCSQILVILGLERQGKDNPDLVRAVTGLGNGLGDCGKICGVLTGAICLLGLYAGRGKPHERPKTELDIMIQDLVSWFEAGFGQQYGGIDCQTILADDSWNRMVRCPTMVTQTYQKAMELLEEYGFLARDDSYE